MNIGIDIRCLMPKHYSGVAEYTSNLLDNIFKIGHKNQFKLFYNSKQDVTKNLPPFNFSNIKIFGFNYSNKLFNFCLKLFHFPKIDHLLLKTDVFFLPNLNFIALSNDCQKIITVHDLSFELFPHFFSAKRRLWHKIINPRKLISGCDKIIAVSANTKNDLVNFYQIPANKIKIIYSGLNQNLYRILEQNEPKFKLIKEKYNLPESFILFLGTLEPRKNISGIIEAFNLLKARHHDFDNLHLVIAGEKGWNYKQIFSLAQNSPFTDQIHYIDFVKSQDKIYIYNLAQLFLFPSFYEGFGFPALEAQACGLPVIAALNSSFPEILNDSAFLIEPDYINEISNAIYLVLSDQNLKKDLITKGLENVKRFSWQTCAEQTLKYISNS